MNETHSLYEVKGEGKGQVKVHPITGHEGPEGEYRCSSTLSLTSVLDGLGGQRYAPTAVGPRYAGAYAPTYQTVIHTE